MDSLAQIGAVGGLVVGSAIVAICVGRVHDHVGSGGWRSIGPNMRVCVCARAIWSAITHTAVDCVCACMPVHVPANHRHHRHRRRCRLSWCAMRCDNNVVRCVENVAVGLVVRCVRVVCVSSCGSGSGERIGNGNKLQSILDKRAQKFLSSVGAI